MLRIENIDVTKIKTITIIIYLVIIRSAIAETSPATKTSSINQRKIPSPRVIISIKSSTAFSYIKKSTFITFIETTFFVKKTSFIETSLDTRFARIIAINEYRPSHIDVKIVIAFAFLKMKKVYNARHQFIFFKIENLINLRLHKNYKISIIISKKIKSQLIKSFKIFERIERLIHRVKLSVNIKIHNVIFIAHLKPTIDSAENSYRKRRLSIFAIIIDDEKEYEIEKLLKKRIIKRERKWFV